MNQADLLPAAKDYPLRDQAERLAHPVEVMPFVTRKVPNLAAYRRATPTWLRPRRCTRAVEGIVITCMCLYFSYGLVALLLFP